MLAAAIVEDVEQIAFVSHIGLPTAAAIVPAGFDIVGVGTAIDIDDGGILLGGVEACGLDHTPVEVGGTISCLHRTTTVLGHAITLPGVGGREVVELLAVVYIDDGNIARGVRCSVRVIEVLTVAAYLGTVPALAIGVDEGALAGNTVLSRRTCSW